VTASAPPPGTPPSDAELAVALATNAAGKRFNIVVLLVAFGAGLALGAPLMVAVLVAVVLYTAAVARTMFDAGEAERVAQTRRGEPPAP
jgi:hypothetical protein